MRRVTIQYHRERDGWWADSPDVPGFSSTAESFNELRARTIGAIAEIIDDDEPFFLHELPPGSRLPEEPTSAGPGAVRLLPAAG